MYLALIPNPGDGLYIAYRLRGAWHDWESTKVGWLRSRCQIRTSNQRLLRKCVLPLSGVTDTLLGQIKGHWTYTVAMPRGPFHKVGSQQKPQLQISRRTYLRFMFKTCLSCGSRWELMFSSHWELILWKCPQVSLDLSPHLNLNQGQRSDIPQGLIRLWPQTALMGSVYSAVVQRLSESHILAPSGCRHEFHTISER